MRLQLLICTTFCIDCVVGWIACLLGSLSTEHDLQYLDFCAYSALQTQPLLDCTTFAFLFASPNFFTGWALIQRFLAITAGWLQFCLLIALLFHLAVTFHLLAFSAGWLQICNLRFLHFHFTADINSLASSAGWPQFYHLGVSHLNLAEDCNTLAFSAGWLQVISSLTPTAGWFLTELSLLDYSKQIFTDHSHLLDFGALLSFVNTIISAISWCLSAALPRAVKIPHFGAPSWLDWTSLTDIINCLRTLAYSAGWLLVGKQRFFRLYRLWPILQGGS